MPTKVQAPPLPGVKPRCYASPIAFFGKQAIRPIQKKRAVSGEEVMDITRRAAVGGLVAGAASVAAPFVVRAQEAKHYRFAYDQPKTTGYGILGDIFANRLKELSNGTMLIDQYPGAQLGQEPQV